MSFMSYTLVVFFIVEACICIYHKEDNRCIHMKDMIDRISFSETIVQSHKQALFLKSYDTNEANPSLRDHGFRGFSLYERHDHVVAVFVRSHHVSRIGACFSYGRFFLKDDLKN